MAMDHDSIRALLRAALPDAEIDLIDLAGDNDHWKAVIVSEQFREMNRIRQHQLVYAALGDKMGGELHALALETRAP